MNSPLQLPPVPGRPAGEIKIWITALGVATGLLMIAGLIAVIGWNGLNAFWPHPLHVFEIARPDAAVSTVHYGSIARESERRDGLRHVAQYQLFTGARDVYGQSFRYIDRGDILSMERDESLMQLERARGGKAVVRPLSLMQEGRSIPYGSPGFDERLAAALGHAASLRERIDDVQKGRISRINHELEEAGRALKALEISYEFTADGSARPNAQVIVSERDPVGRRRELQSSMAALDEQYAACIRDIETLRAQEGDATLVYELGDGTERQIAVGDLIGYTQPNRLGWMGRAGVFLSGIWKFVSEDPREANTEGGIFPAIFGTFVMTVLMSILVTPIGVIAAIYLREYARQGLVVRTVRICVNNLAGVPSIVFGVFGLGFFVYVLGGNIDQLFFSDRLAVSNAPTFGTSGVLWASLTLALMTLPVVIVATEESLSTVSRGLREAALACGASKWQMVQRIILPRAMPGILTGIILAMARGAGEVAPLMITGVVKLAPDLPIDFEAPFVHLERKFMHLGFHIYDVAFQSPDSDAARPMVFATSLLLITLVVFMNLIAIYIRNRLRRRHRQLSF